jgi:hypothetical protein
VCHQSVGLIARHAEGNGISTVCLSSALDITQSVNPPRAAFLDFPLGHTSGKANEPELQFSIARDALTALEEMKTPGSIKILPYRWNEEESWRNQELFSDSRLPRTLEPQFQYEEDRILYESRSV